jgi:hypothetical protein
MQAHGRELHGAAATAVMLQGETLQGRFPCGCSVFAEQVSHHPPVSCWQVLDHNGQVSRQLRLAGWQQQAAMGKSRQPGKQCCLCAAVAQCNCSCFLGAMRAGHDDDALLP